jgi:hypothetical protein
VPAVVALFAAMAAMSFALSFTAKSFVALTESRFCKTFKLVFSKHSVAPESVRYIS